MDFRGTVVAIRDFGVGNPSVQVRADHDPRILAWAEWQTYLRGRPPKIGDRVRLTTSGPVKIAF